MNYGVHLDFLPAVSTRLANSMPPRVSSLRRGGLLPLMACLAALCLCPATTCAQSLASPAPPKDASSRGPWVPPLSSMGQDAIDLLGAPATLSPSEQLLALGISGAAFGAVAALDRPVYHGLSQQPGWAASATGPLAGPGRWFDRVGPDRATYAAAGLLATGGLVLGRRDFTRTSVRVLEALFLTKAVTGFAKGLVNRSRPFAGEGPFRADPGGFDSAHEELSMPSGHTARAFALASVLSHQADRWYVSALAYGGAASVGMERVRSGDHWLTDVVVGGTLGYLIGRTVIPEASSPGDGITYAPILSTYRVGLSVQF